MSLERLRAAYENHAVWQKIGDLEQQLKDAPDRDTDSSEDAYDLIVLMVSHLGERGANYSPLISQNVLQQVDTQVSQVTAQVTNWISSKNDTHLQQALMQVSAVLDLLRSWPPAKDRYLKGSISAAEHFQGQADDALDALSERVAGADEVVRTVASSIKESQTEIEKALAGLALFVEQQREAAQEQVDRIDRTLNGLQDTFITAEQERSEKFAKAQDEHAANAKLAAIDQQEDGEKYIARLGELEAQAKKLVDAVGLTGTATEYGRYASDEKAAADRWRLGAVAGFAASFLMFVVTLLFEDFSNGTSWQLVIVRLGGALALLGFGLYSARESAQHRRQERDAKAKQLDLAALDPFLATLPQSERHTIKAAAARRLFSDGGPSTSSAPECGQDLDSNETIQLLRAFLTKQGQ